MRQGIPSRHYDPCARSRADTLAAPHPVSGGIADVSHAAHCHARTHGRTQGLSLRGPHGHARAPASTHARTRAVGCRDACQGERTAFSLFPIICSTFVSSKRCLDCAPEHGSLHADVRSGWEWRTWYSRQLPSFGNTTLNPSRIQTKRAAHETRIAAWGAPRAHSALLIQEASPCRVRCKHLAARRAHGLAVHLAFDHLH